MPLEPPNDPAHWCVCGEDFEQGRNLALHFIADRGLGMEFQQYVEDQDDHEHDLV